MPRPAVIHCTLPGSGRPTLPALSRWRIRPSSMIVTASKPRCGWLGKPPMQSLAASLPKASSLGNGSRRLCNGWVSTRVSLTPSPSPSEVGRPRSTRST